MHSCTASGVPLPTRAGNDGHAAPATTTNQGARRRACARSADGGLIDLGTLAGSHSRGQFVTEAGAIIGVSSGKGHRTHAFVWTEAGGLVEMPSLGRVEHVTAASGTGAFTGLTIDKKSNGLHAVLWAPSPASSKR